ncbi:MAG: hypothetical protein AB8G86_21275 [Saprospiraceae bacterium]
MQQLTPYQFLSRSIILLTFVSLFLADSVVYWMLEMNNIKIELCDFSDSESEKEEKKNEELLDDKFPFEFSESEQTLWKRYLMAFSYIDSKSSPNREILTPPPKYFAV